jgi:signal transduction histidine kinase
MSSHPESFQWSVGTPDAHGVDVNDEMMERPQQRASAAFSSHSQSVANRFDALRRKDEILAIVAHELRGPLTPMQLAIQLIRRVSADRPDVLRSIDMLDRQITQISRLAEDLMDATRIDLGALRVSKVPSEVVAILAGPLTAAALTASQRGQTFTVQIADRALRIEGDPVRLAQAVSNLLNNAVKYTPENGCVAVNVLADGQDLVVSVKDNGLGISDALRPHIFDLFAQSSRTIAASAGGLGVGLAVVKAVAESHGGTVSATSAGPGSGSEFTLRLPIVLKQRMAREPA